MRPCWRAKKPYPPPRVRPLSPTPEHEPEGSSLPCLRRWSYVSPNLSPGPARKVWSFAW